MNKSSRAAVAVAAVALAAGCTNLNGGSLGQTFFAEGFLNEQIGGSGYNAALARAYQEIAAYNAGTDVNWLDTTVYMQRSRAAAAGNPPELFQPSEYGVNGDLEALRVQVLQAVGEHGATRPEACGGMAANYDWLVEHTYQQPGADLDAARSRFDASLSECVGVEMADMTVFFGFGSAELDSVARGIIDDVVSQIGAASSAISVVGHTDTVGSVAANQVLSERRASAVAGRMTTLGVSPGRITQAGRGELEPAEVTGDGVRNARNRRVEIIVSE